MLTGCSPIHVPCYHPITHVFTLSQSFSPSCPYPLRHLLHPQLGDNCIVLGVGRKGQGTRRSPPASSMVAGEESPSWTRMVVWDFREAWGHERRCRRGEPPAVGGNGGHLPPPSPPWAPANRPDLRARGAQDAKHTAKLFDVILPGKKWGPIQQLPQDAAHGPADTKPKQLYMDRDLPTPAPSPHTMDTERLTTWTEIFPHQLHHLTPWTRITPHQLHHSPP